MTNLEFLSSGHFNGTVMTQLNNTFIIDVPYVAVNFRYSLYSGSCICLP